VSQQRLSEWKIFSLDLSQLQENAKQQQDHLEMHQLRKKTYAKPFHDSTAVSTGTYQENPVATTTCSSQSHDDKPELYESDNLHDLVKRKVLMTSRLLC